MSGPPAPTRELPRAPWGSFPLTELTVLAALGLAMATVLTWGTDRAVWAALGSMALGLLAGFELSLREHLSARRRHSGLLACTVTVGAIVVAFLARSPALALVPVAAVAFGVAFAGFESAFRRAAQRAESLSDVRR